MAKIAIKVESLGESIKEATVGRIVKDHGKIVEKDDLLIELETEKVTMEVNALAFGKFELLVKEGQVLTIGEIIGYIDDSVVPSENKSVEQSVVKQESVKQNTISSEKPLSPAVSKIVKENNLNPNLIVGTGKEGRLIKEDVLNVINTGSTQDSSTRLEERVRMSRLRKKIAERLKDSQNTAAILTTFNEVDMSKILEIRTKYKDVFEKKHGVKLGFMSFFVKASISALKEIAAVNAEISGDDVIYKKYYDIGVAVGTEQGLVVPVVRDADKMSFADIEKSIAEYGKKARDGKLSMQDLTGGTFTISNGGVYGSLLSTPIINPPQSAILGMHKTQERPVAINGKVEIRPMMYLALSYDHRIIDGREAVTFLVKIKDAIEDPERLLFDI